MTVYQITQAFVPHTKNGYKKKTDKPHVGIVILSYSSQSMIQE